MLTWGTAGYTSCSLTSSAGGGVLSTAVNEPSPGLSQTINGPTVFTLKCDSGGAPTSYTLTVDVLPTYIEI